MYCYEYPRMLVTVDAVIFRTDTQGHPVDLLLIERKNEPYKGCYALPGGFPEMNELLSDAAARELKEETGLDGITLKQVGAFDRVDRDPRDRNISVAYLGFASADSPLPNAGDDAATASWFPLNNLPPLAFDHAEILEKALSNIGI
ncbi:MAG TPA: NUDIX hydrolase [Tenuifilaceae bacterium]|nr:NUDIX hydrolase [Bacteroidales bacterium]HNY08643.1 NUDIX hydrolase [Tenuifilaceae bacterium]MBP8642490.1 NUDIX hydrolase [Bacteroidales bacterium]NLI86656.1 NUDIX hydrolase [Bacteroidales bacterium]HOA09059.1 NUDIX hydrolase [Tenuifilaceae bacterium]